MSKSAVALCVPQTPFFPTGASLYAKRLKQEVLAFGCDPDIISLPLNWHNEDELLSHSFAWRLMEMEEANGRPVNKLICLGWPSFFLAHKNKTVWLLEPLDWAWRTSGLQISLSALEPFHAMISAGIKECRKKYSSFPTEEKEYERLLAPSRLDISPAQSNKGEFILAASSHRKQNALDELLKAAAQSHSRRKIVLTGTGPETEILKSLAAELKLDGRVEFTGFVSDQELLKLYGKAAAVYAGNDYTLSRPEAEAAGLPILSPSSNLADLLDEPSKAAHQKSPRPSWKELLTKLI